MLQKLAATGKLETAAQLLNPIPARQAAKVLSEIAAPGLTEEILKDLKQKPPPAGTE
jgi:hypothetical protein